MLHLLERALVLRFLHGVILFSSPTSSGCPSLPPTPLFLLQLLEGIVISRMKSAVLLSNPWPCYLLSLNLPVDISDLARSLRIELRCLGDFDSPTVLLRHPLHTCIIINILTALYRCLFPHLLPQINSKLLNAETAFSLSMVPSTRRTTHE